jgi:hypothetical protein
MKYVPPEGIKQGLLNDLCIAACTDSAYLINRNYPKRGTLRLAGDRRPGWLTCPGSFLRHRLMVSFY